MPPQNANDRQERAISPALEVLGRAAKQMAQVTGFGQPAVELPIDAIHIAASDIGGYRCFIGMDDLMILIERLERYLPKESP